MIVFRNLVLICISLFCVTASAQAIVEPSRGQIETFTTTKSFSDVVLEIDFAITHHNFRITSRNNLSEGIRERGHTHFPNFEIVHFCNLELAREALEIDPGYIVHMPCKITIHEQGDTTIIGLVKLPENHHDLRMQKFAKKVNQQLVNIVNFAVSF